ncbi:MAG: response regulator [Candidatus Binatia bacterium]
MRPEKVLVVDDHRDILELLTTQLGLLGWEAVPASSGQEALEKLKGVTPRLILLDMRMPEMDGFEFVRYLRRNPDHRDIPILAVTALAMPGDREHCLKVGCDDCISKPFTLQDLQQRLTFLMSASNPCTQVCQVKQNGQER